MNCPIDTLRKLLSSGTAALMIAISVAVPLMDRGEVSVELAAESEHHPATCQHAHDHTVCTQLSANVSVAQGTYQHRSDLLVVDVSAPVGIEPAVAEPYRDGPPSRAPPPDLTV